VTREILDNGKYGMLKSNDPKSLSEGMEIFLKKENPIYQEFDIKGYNDLALSQFYKIFD